MRGSSSIIAVSAFAALIGACFSPDAPDRTVVASPPDGTPAVALAVTRLEAAAVRSGAAIAVSAQHDALFIADEDHRALYHVPLPLDVRNPPQKVPLEGAPAQVVALSDRILVTLRDPGRVLAFRYGEDGLAPIGGVDVAADAWGIAVTADAKTAVVSSAWSHTITGIDVATLQQRFAVDVGREPRGVAITPAGVAYVGHLVGRRLTRIAGLDTTLPVVSTIDLPAAPLRATDGFEPSASLSYAPILSPDGGRLLVPRHALGAQGFQAWFGAGTVDVLDTTDDRSDTPRRARHVARFADSFIDDALGNALFDSRGAVPLIESPFVQPRAAAYRASRGTILVASEGSNTLVELDARALDPALKPLRTISLGTYDTSLPEDHPSPRVVVRGGAPSGIALSADEKVAYVFCRSTYDVMAVRLEGPVDPIAFLHLDDDPLGPELARGRRLFYDATDVVISGGLGCAGCHPEGRDDGHVWHERGALSGGPLLSRYASPPVLGLPRQTPMLAGRVVARGPYGWKGESATLEDRLRLGFAIHRWQGEPSHMELAVTMERPKLLADFLRKGLVAPPENRAPLSAAEARGKEVFARDDTGCATCHAERGGFTDRSLVELPRPAAVNGFEDEEDRRFKTPSLRFVGGTAPYFHDGGARTLEAVVFENFDRMGSTQHLTQEQRADLVAYLKRL